MITYERITVAEAGGYYQLMKQLDQETDKMLYAPDERSRDLAKLAEEIAAVQRAGLLLGAKNQAGELVGMLAAEGSRLAKIKHSAYIVTGILAAYQGQGIATGLFQELEQWAKANQLLRLELTVMAHNQKAVALYQKMGFAIEGTRRGSILLKDQLLDEYYMGKLL